MAPHHTVAARAEHIAEYMTHRANNLHQALQAMRERDYPEQAVEKQHEAWQQALHLANIWVVVSVAGEALAATDWGYA